MQNPSPSTFIGQGKVEEIAEAVEMAGAEVVVFDEELTPAQGRNLQKVATPCPVLTERMLLPGHRREGLVLLDRAYYCAFLPAYATATDVPVQSESARGVRY
eukprot:1881913-Rhodomonas_salina.2